MLSVPAPLAELGVDDELKAALRKLAASLPDAQRTDPERVHQRIHLDAMWWSQGQEPVPHLRAVHEAMWQDLVLSIQYRQAYGTPSVIERSVEPYGLVAKGGVWYLVCARNGRMRVHRVSHLLDVRLSDASFERAPDFDLAAFWRSWCADTERTRTDYRVLVRVAPDFAGWLSHYLGESIRIALAQAGPPDRDGWIVLELRFENLWAAGDRILSFGRGVEVLAPKGLRLSVLDYATQIVDLYGNADRS